MLLAEYKSKDINFIKDIDGSYIFVIKDSRQKAKNIKVVTDRVNSLKFFYRRTNSGCQITFDKSEFEINKKAIACYLANGNMLNGLTLFKNIRMAEGASIYTFENEEIKYEKYCEVKFNYDPNKKDIENAKIELKEKILNSIKSRVDAAGSVVTKSIPDNEIWGGNPAKLVRKLD